MLPDSIGSLSNLRGLTINNNQMISIPDGIGNLTSVIDLSIGSNQLIDLPATMSNLTGLKKLSASNNLLGDDDSNIIVSMSSLNALDIDENQFTDLSSYEDCLVNPRGGETYFLLSANGNKITNLSFLGDVSTLPFYTVLNVENNQIKDFSFLSHFPMNTFYGSDAYNQNVNAEKVQLRGNQLSIDFPYIESGFPATNYKISNGGYLSNGKIIWDNIPDDLTELTIDYGGYMSYFSYSVNYTIPIAHMYELSVDLNEGQGNAAKQLIEQGALAIAVENPTRAGFTFKEWNTSRDGSGSV